MGNRIPFFLVFFIFIFIPFYAQGKEPAKKEPSTNLVVLKISGNIPEFITVEGLDEKQTSLHKLLESVYKAKNDPEVQGLILEVGEISMGRAKISALSQALAQFRTSGKPIYSYFESVSTGQYLIACQSSRLSIYPTGELFIPGVAMQMMFIKGLLGKLGVEADFITQGKYKSAAEMMTRESSSAPAKEAHMAMINDLYDGLVSSIAQARNLDEKKVKHLLDQGIINSKEAAECKLIDFAEYQDEFEAAMTAAHKDPIKKITNYNQKQAPQLDPSSIFSMFSFFSQVFNPNKQS
ncbi:MAG: S49 family peptidase, partial [Planctomycetota bacterium]